MSSFNLKIHFEELVIVLAKDTGVLDEDAEYVIRRFKSEGLRFLLFTLPSLSKAMLYSLENGVFLRPTSFAWKRKSLYFMYSFFSKIFNPSTGIVLDDACPHSIAAVRQFCEYFYKLAVETDDSAKQLGEQKYVENEESLGFFEPCPKWTDNLKANLETYYPTFCGTPVSSVLTDYRPRFGPGAFAGSVPNKALYKKLPADYVGLTSSEFRAFSGFFKSYPSSKEMVTLPFEDKISVVTFVAKDARGPRVISMEPMHLLRMQMSFLDWSIKTLEKCTDGRIQFTDQSGNQKRAKTASIDRACATLDLKDASDRVSFKFVNRIFINTQAPRFFLQNARSTHTLLPSGRVMRLRKVAGMGSGLTFPIMSLIIHLSICTLVSERLGVPYKKIMRSVHVYGDDVIVPTSWYNFAVTALQRSGLLVNTDKSFFRSHFRESCGGDFYKGISVTPTKLRLDKVDLCSASTYRRFLRLDSPRMLYKLNAHTRELLHSGMVFTKGYYDALLRKALGPTNYPQVTGSSPLIGEYVERLVIRDDVRVRAYTLNPVRSKSTRICPYKHIMRALQPHRSIKSYDVFKDLISEASLSFGEYIRPRDMKLALKWHPGTSTY